jgi:hypothetical protein
MKWNVFVSTTFLNAHVLACGRRSRSLHKKMSVRSQSGHQSEELLFLEWQPFTESARLGYNIT